ncbi:hypothetical protein EXS71_02915 [Candidatus Uhrbacteria bacterium]|nr:hypothetical protein [Candidatus Uhrbacteria bacterium]
MKHHFMTFSQRTLATISALMLLMSPLMSQASVTGAFNAGELIKGSGDTVYYFAGNGKRYVFPNAKTYFTWYKDFSSVKTISDGQLSTIPLGGNVTYRPGYKMIKVMTDPKTYVIDQGGFLRHVTTESLAQTLYGISWKNQIDDVPDAFFVNYRVGTAIQTASDYNAANTMTTTVSIGQDKQLDETKITITIGAMQNGFVPTSITFKKGTEVTWTNGDNAAHWIKGSNFDSGMLTPGQTYKHIFNTAGSFDYRCNIHSTMQGTINVVN